MTRSDGLLAGGIGRLLTDRDSELSRRHAVTTAHWSKQATGCDRLLCRSENECRFFRRPPRPYCSATMFARRQHGTFQCVPLRSATSTPPAILLRNYAKRKRPQEADKKLGEAISTDDGGLSHDVTTTESNARTPIRKLLPKICPD